jgi:archaellum component FlaF (FlaF/FlaG flagellin family)
MIKPVSIFVGVFLVIGNYIYFTYNNRYQKILNTYQTESAAAAKRGNVIIMLITFGSFCAFICGAVFLGIHVK